LLASGKMKAFLDEIGGQFDYVIIDTPPLNVVADALPLIKNSDGVILVVRSGISTYPELNKTVKSLEMVNAKILGIILNAVEQKDGHSGYGYGKYGYYGSYGTYGS
jgi:Mrp family chromosome partitioning ATPase